MAIKMSGISAVRLVRFLGVKRKDMPSLTIGRNTSYWGPNRNPLRTPVFWTQTGTLGSSAALAPRALLGQAGVPHLPGSSKSQKRQEEWKGDGGRKPAHEAAQAAARGSFSQPRTGSISEETCQEGVCLHSGQASWSKDRCWAVKAAGFTGDGKGQRVLHTGDKALNLCRHSSCADESFGGSVGARAGEAGEKPECEAKAANGPDCDWRPGLALGHHGPPAANTSYMLNKYLLNG